MAGKTTKDNQDSGRKRGGFLPFFCNLFGTLLIIVVFALTLPLTAPRLMGYQVYEVVSGSMEPAIPLGSAVYVREAKPSDIEIDDIIAFHDGESIVTHRVVANRTTSGEFVTKGDANNTEDLSPVPYDALIGTVERTVPVVGQFMRLYTSNVGKVYLLLTAACGIMLNILADRMRAARSQRIRQELAANASVAAEEGVEEAPVDEKVRQRRRRRARLRTALMVILAVVFLGSGGTVVYVLHEYSVSDQKYEAASSSYTRMKEEEEPDPTYAPITVDFDSLRAVNEDVVGWIYCADTPIDYPLLHGETNKQYLRTDYTKEYNLNGSIFVDCDNRPGFVDANTIIYGHHMNQGAMFATLENWAEQSYYEEHPVMWLLTPEQDYQVVLVSGHHVSAYSDMYDIYAEHDENFDHYLNEAIEMSDFEPVEGADVNPQRNYVMLTTCAYVFDNARYVLHGKLVPVDSAGGVPLQ